MCDIWARPLLIGLSGSPFRNYYGDPRRVALSTELNCDRLPIDILSRPLQSA